MENKNIFQIKNIRHNILKFLIKPICQNCMENETKNRWRKLNLLFDRIAFPRGESRTLYHEIIALI